MVPWPFEGHPVHGRETNVRHERLSVAGGNLSVQIRGVRSFVDAACRVLCDHSVSVAGFCACCAFSDPRSAYLPVPVFGSGRHSQPCLIFEPPPATSAWPLTVDSARGLEPVFEPDGTVYFLTGGLDTAVQLVALDRGGHVRPGWPIEARPSSSFGSPAVAPDGSVYFEECAGPTVGCLLHRLDVTGRDRTGWPVELPADFACSVDGACSTNPLLFAPDGTALVSHGRQTGGLQVLAIDDTGVVKPGWPVVPDADAAVLVGRADRSRRDRVHPR